MASTSESPTGPPPQPPPPGNPSTSQPPTVLDAIKTISPLTDLQRLPTIPCARYSLLFGIVAGASVGTVRFLFSRAGTVRWDTVLAATNWAVGAWGVGSLGAWETCRRRQSADSARMHALVAEIKARRAAKPPSSSSPPKHGPGGVLIGEKGQQMLREKQEREKREQEPPALSKETGDQPKSWWRRWV